MNLFQNYFSPGLCVFCVYPCCKTVHLCSVLDQLHPAIFQVDETDSHPPQQLQMFKVVCHEVLSPERRTAHTRLPERRERSKTRKKLKHGRCTAVRENR